MKKPSILDRLFGRGPELEAVALPVVEAEPVAFVPDASPDGKRLYAGINARLRTDAVLHGKTAVEATEIFNTMTIAEYVFGRELLPEEVGYVHSGQFMADLQGSKQKPQEGK